MLLCKVIFIGLLGRSIVENNQFMTRFNSLQDLLDKLNLLQEELDKEKTWVEHLEEQNDQFRMDLSGKHTTPKLCSFAKLLPFDLTLTNT